MIIDSPANPTVKTLRSLEHAKNRQAHKLFLVEGVRAVGDGLRAGFLPAICLYNPELLSRTERGSVLLKQLASPAFGDANAAKPIEASVRALEAASATQHPQGVIAAFPVVEWPPAASSKDAPALALVCDDIQDPGNLGTLLRTAEAAGVTGVWLSPRCVDHYNPKVVRAAMGAHFRLPVYVKDWPGIAEDLHDLGIPQAQLYATDAGAQLPYDMVDWTRPSALIVSNEAHGLGEEAMGLSGGVIAVPMAGDPESLNAATAAAVILFEAARQRRLASG